MDYESGNYRNKPNLFAVISFSIGLGILLIAPTVESTEAWPLGNMSIPVAVLAVFFGGWWTVRSIIKSRRIPHVAIYISTESTSTPIFLTNDKAWAERVVEKLQDIAGREQGDWEVHANEKSISQL